MDTTIIETDKAPKAIGPYSQAVSKGNMLFISGQLGLDPETGKIPQGDIALQAELALKNLLSILNAAGLDPSHVVKATIFLTDMNDFAKVNEVYGKFFKAPYPARACVEVSRLPKDGKVEIEAIAIKG
ncbi:RidA family protein [Elusimicrobiota bacterium]